MLNIDKLRYEWEKPFLDLMEGMKKKKHPKFKSNILWFKDKKWFFEESNIDDNVLWCNSDLVWEKIRFKNGFNHSETSLFIKQLMKKYYDIYFIPHYLNLRHYNIFDNYKINLINKCIKFLKRLVSFLQ